MKIEVEQDDIEGYIVEVDVSLCASYRLRKHSPKQPVAPGAHTLLCLPSIGSILLAPQQLLLL
jgi:hypothetical protein